MHVTQEEVDRLPLIPLDEFEFKVNDFGKENIIVRKLCKDLGSWEKFPAHLLRQLFSKIGAKPIINKY